MDKKKEKKVKYLSEIIIFDSEERIRILKNIEEHLHGPNWSAYYGSRIVLEKEYAIGIENDNMINALYVFKLLCLYKDKEVKLTKIV